METYPIIPRAKYDDPQRLIKIPERENILNSKTLVVLCNYTPVDFNSGYNTRAHETHEYRWYSHNRLESLRFTLACYDHYDAGLPYDLCIVDNSSPFILNHSPELVRSAFADVHLHIPNNIEILTRENTFFSFGAYKYAWERYWKDYDYFVFHELDWSPCHNGWLSQLVDMWVQNPEVGMIGNLIESRGWSPNPLSDNAKTTNKHIAKINPKRLKQTNLDSEYLFTDKPVLLNMEANGGWLLFQCSPEVDLSPAYNELAFQQPLLEMGYELLCFNDGKYTMMYAIYNQGFPDKWWNGVENLAPFFPEQSRLFCTKMRDYFDFYDHEKFNSFRGWG